MRSHGLLGLTSRSRELAQNTAYARFFKRVFPSCFYISQKQEAKAAHAYAAHDEHVRVTARAAAPAPEPIRVAQGRLRLHTAADVMPIRNVIVLAPSGLEFGPARQTAEWVARHWQPLPPGCLRSPSSWSPASRVAIVAPCAARATRCSCTSPMPRRSAAASAHAHTHRTHPHARLHPLH